MCTSLSIHIASNLLSSWSSIFLVTCLCLVMFGFSLPRASLPSLIYGWHLTMRAHGQIASDKDKSNRKFWSLLSHPYLRPFIFYSRGVTANVDTHYVMERVQASKIVPSAGEDVVLRAHTLVLPGLYLGTALLDSRVASCARRGHVLWPS